MKSKSFSVSAAILAAGTAAVYCRTFAVPLLMDDNSSIAENLSIRRLWPLWPVLIPPKGYVRGRPLINLSYALNYAFGGNAVFGYHLVNLAIHVLATLTLFALVRRTLLRPALSKRFGPAATPLAFAVSAIWAWHPVQTESVTYLSQRAESLMGLFYLLTLYCFIRYADEAGDRPKAISGKPKPQANAEGSGNSGLLRLSPTAYRLPPFLWGLLSVLACLAGVASKEVIVTAPLMAFLYDRTFLSGSFSGAWRRHWPLFLALAATWIPLGCLMTGVSDLGVGLGWNVPWWAYGITECRVVVKYLLLAFWPHPLVFDYGVYANPHLAGFWPYVLMIASLLTVTILALRRSPAAGFGACWFFLILAPVSSVIPVLAQPMAENRMYLPLAGVVALTVLGAFALAGRWSLFVSVALAAALGVASFERNRDYVSEQAIWSDTVAKSPGNARARNNLGVILGKAPGRSKDAIAQLQAAIRLQPNYVEAHSNLGNALLNEPGRLNDAIAQLEEAIRLYPDFAGAHNNLGNALLRMPGRLNDAIAQYEEALRLEPFHAETHNNLGIALSDAGRWTEAIAEFKETVRLDPDFAKADYNLGNAFSHLGRLPEAIASYGEARRLSPDNPDYDFNLGSALTRDGRAKEAIPVYEHALRLNPDNAPAHVNIGIILAGMNRLTEAIAHYQEALRLDPGLANAHNDLGTALAQTGHLEEATAQFEQAVRLDPHFYMARLNLGHALMLTGRTAEARAQFEEAARLRGNEPLPQPQPGP